MYIYIYVYIYISSAPDAENRTARPEDHRSADPRHANLYHNIPYIIVFKYRNITTV